MEFLPNSLTILLCILPNVLLPAYFLKSMQLLEIFGAILTFLQKAAFGTFLKTVQLSSRNEL